MKQNTILFSILFILFGTAGHAAPIDLQTAKTVCWNYNNARQIVALNDIEEINITHTVSFSNIRSTAYYIFNLDDHGFMIVSGNDIFPPVLGYSNQNTFDLQNRAPAFSQLLKDYRMQMEMFIGYEILPSPEITELWQQILTNNIPSCTQSIESLVTAQWGQSKYYNSFCPADAESSSGHALAGCVAVAIAQLMHYWKFPSSGVDSFGYHCDNYGFLSAHFQQSKYRYNKMINSLNNHSTPSAIHEVAKLIYHCGIGVKMQYGTFASGASSLGTNYPSAEYALKNYFKFGKCTGLSRSNFSDGEWVSIIKDELDNERPIYYAGTTEGGSGHAFLCDGYAGNLFHINWGWGGINNGFFLLSGLISGSSHYLNHHRIIIKIQPTNHLSIDIPLLHFATTLNVSSPIQIVKISSEMGKHPIYATASGPFSISTNIDDWGTSCVLPVEGGTVFVRYQPMTHGNHNGELTFSSENGNTPVASLYGTCHDKVIAFPWFEGFESGNIPNSWSVSNSLVHHQWMVYAGDRRNTPPFQGNYNLYFNYPNSSNPARSFLVFNTFELNRLASPKLSFAILKANWLPDVDTLNVYYDNGDGNEWRLLKNYSQSIDTWQVDTIPLPQPSDNYRIAFEGIAKYAHGIAIDNLSVWGEENLCQVRCQHTEGGTLSLPTSSSFAIGDSIRLLIMPNPSHSIGKILINNMEIDSENTICIDSIYENMDIFVLFHYTGSPDIKTETCYPFNADIGSYSDIQQINIQGFKLVKPIHVIVPSEFEVYDVDSWETNTTLPREGGMLHLRFHPGHVSDITDSVVLQSGYFFRKIIVNGTVNQPFIDFFTIYASCNTGGAIIPCGIQYYAINDTAVFKINADSGFVVSHISVDGQQVETTPFFHFKNIIENHTIHAEFTVISGISEENRERSITVFPNPVHDMIHIKTENILSSANYGIYDMQGRMVLRGNVMENETVPVSELVPGLYFLRIATDDSISTARFIKE